MIIHTFSFIIILPSAKKEAVIKITGKIIILLTLFINIPFLLYAEDNLQIKDNSPVRIAEINTSIEKRTKRSALLRQLKLKENSEYDSIDELNRILYINFQKLERRRIFKELEWSVDQLTEDTVAVNIKVVDSFSLWPRPIIKYNSNIGVTLGARVDYFNAFGTLTDMKFQGYWSPKEYYFNLDIANLIFGPFTVNPVFEQFDGTTRYGSPNGDILVNFRNSYTLIKSEFEVQLSPLNEWVYQITPVFKWQYNYRIETNNSDLPDSWFEDYGFAVGFDNGISTDRVNWKGNFREGFFLELINQNLWYTKVGKSDIFFETSAIGFKPLSEWLEISGRTGGFYAVDGVYLDAGKWLRGVRDYNTYGEWGIYTNLQINFLLFTIMNQLEFQLRPFTDLAYIKSNQWDNGMDSFEYCAGTSVLIYIKSLPNLSLNLDVGWDIKRGQLEVIFDTVHFLTGK